MGEGNTAPTLHRLHQRPQPNPIDLVCHLIAPSPIGHQIDPKLDWSMLGTVVDLADYHTGLHALDQMGGPTYIDPANGFQPEFGGQQ